MFRSFVVLMLLSFAISTARAQDCQVELSERARQGALVIGKASPSCALRLGERPLRVAADGTFLFGVGRDATGTLDVIARAPDGRETHHALTVVARTWQVERVNGVPESTVTPPPDIAARIAREQAEVARARERDDDRQDFRFGFIWPVQGRVSGVFGSQRVLNGKPRDPHMGLDIARPTGTPVMAPAGGVISFAKPDLYLTGGTVVLDHGHGLSSVFVHLSRLDVKPGQRIEQGERIGLVGMTGRATGPHLHWGMNWFDVRIDPGLLVDAPERPQDR